MNTHPGTTIGRWSGDSNTLATGDAGLLQAIRRLEQPVFLVSKDGALGASHTGQIAIGANGSGGHPLIGFAPASPLNQMGDAEFLRDHGLKYAYLGGSMAHGISSPEIAIELGKAGMLGFIGSAGQSPESVEAALDRMQRVQPAVPFGFNLIHSPNEPMLEMAIVDLYLRRGLRLVEASAYLAMTLPLIKYRVAGIHRGPDGTIVTPNKIIGKASRVEVASKFFAPPPEKMLQELVAQGFITPEQAQLAAQIPVAQDVTAEADSGGHTDNRPAVCLVPTFIALRDRLQKQYNYPIRLRVGAGGGIATPASAAAAFAMGASWLMIGSVHQACRESGTSQPAREMLCQAGQADVAMAPAGDMFEMGVTVQVLKRGTMFAMRASKLYELYRAHQSLEQIPPADRENLEKNFFRMTFEQVWDSCHQFFSRRDPHQLERAARDPHHKMALVFRWYLGQSPRWAVSGEPTRKMDYQVWCGPAMGAYNEWVKGTPFEKSENRGVVNVAFNLLFGAGVVLRQQALKTQGVPLPEAALATPPMTTEEIFAALGSH